MFDPVPGLALHYLCVDFILSCGRSARVFKNIYKEQAGVRANQKPFLIPWFFLVLLSQKPFHLSFILQWRLKSRNHFLYALLFLYFQVSVCEVCSVSDTLTWGQGPVSFIHLFHGFHIYPSGMHLTIQGTPFCGSWVQFPENLTRAGHTLFLPPAPIEVPTSPRR